MLDSRIYHHDTNRCAYRKCKKRYSPATNIHYRSETLAFDMPSRSLIDMSQGKLCHWNNSTSEIWCLTHNQPLFLTSEWSALTHWIGKSSWTTKWIEPVYSVGLLLRYTIYINNSNYSLEIKHVAQFNISKNLLTRSN